MSSDDGITHINIYSKAKTQIGRDLSNFSHHPFCHPDLGQFSSIEGLWYWLTRQDERLRSMSGYEAKKLGQSLAKVRVYNASEFERLICLGLQAKLSQHRSIESALFATSLPLTHYYVQHYGGVEKTVTPKNCEWILAYFERERLKANPMADQSNSLLIDSARHQETKEPSQMGLF